MKTSTVPRTVAHRLDHDHLLQVLHPLRALVLLRHQVVKVELHRIATVVAVRVVIKEEIINMSYIF